MKKVLTDFVIISVLFLSACGSPPPALTPTPASIPTNTPVPTSTPIPVSADRPCIGAPAPAQWHHIVVLIFENKTYDQVIGPAPYITSLADKCATALHWNDANTKVDGSPDGKYASKPNYATLTNGLSPSVHGLVDDSY